MLAAVLQRTQRCGAQVAHTVRAFSSSARQLDDESVGADWGQMIRTIDETAEQQQQLATSGNMPLNFHNFRANYFLQPGDLRISSRTFRRAGFSRPPQLGPSASSARSTDVFHQLAIDPSWEYKNATLLSAFQTSMAKILPRTHTRLTWKSQRKLRKAIKRAKMMGITPLWSQSGQMARMPTQHF